MKAREKLDMQFTRHKEMKNTNVWWKRGVIYQIYPRSFKDSNADGIGDLDGILEKLDYLVDLGIDAIWMSPIYPSPMADFGYDVSDYTDIHPLFGGMESFERLLEAAHRKGLKIILDYVPNHTSDEHPWFVESRSSRQSAKRDWYIWRDAKPDGSLPNNWESFFGGPAWTWDEHTQQYYLHLFLDKQPDLNWTNDEVVNAMHGILHFWLDKGVDGFRMDVVTFLMKHPEMPDNPVIQNREHNLLQGQRHVYDINQPEVHEILRQFRSIFDTYPGERVIIGETWFPDPKELVSYYGKDLDELHLPFNFITLKQPWQASQIQAVIQNYYDALPEGAIPNFVFGNHDTHRLATRYGRENLRSVGLLLLTQRGVPTMYYGDEIGMEDVIVSPVQYKDPVAIQNPETNDGRDPERSPMQWNDEPNAGFCPANVEPWLPIASNYREVNVAKQLNDSTSTLAFYKKLLNLRRELEALQKGDLTLLDDLPADMMAYTRKAGSETVLIIINFGGSEHKLDLEALSKQGEVLISTRMNPTNIISMGQICLAPHEGLLIKFFEEAQR
jgi:alpha-glucosidase